MRRRLTRNLLSGQRTDVGGGKAKASTVEVRRVPWGTTYARVSTVGHEGDRAFVLVPGIGVSSNYFERLAARLNDYGPVHALDLPGFGGVPHPKSRRMSIPEYADLVGKVIDELEIDDPVVVGHSMGTQVVTDLAARYPEGFAGTDPLSSVILLGPVLNPDERTLSLAARRFLQAARKEPPRVAVLALEAYLLCGVRWFSRVLPEMMHYPIEEMLPRLRSNTLVISGELDALCPPEWIDEVAQLLPSCRVSIIPDAAHSIMHAHADEVARLSVGHVRHPGTDPLPPPEPETASEGEAKDAPRGLDELTGQVTELVGIVTDDDELIAQGKTAQAQAVEQAEAGAGEDGSGEDGSGESEQGQSEQSESDQDQSEQSESEQSQSDQGESDQDRTDRRPAPDESRSAPSDR